MSMPFQIVRNDITQMKVDAIVNTANPKPIVGSGTDAGIHQKAGAQLLEARKQIGNIAVGCAAMTPGFALPAKYVIHTVGPVWRGGFLGEVAKLRQCYDAALNLAKQEGCKSIAFPLISTGNYGFPKDRALRIAIDAFSDFLMTHEMDIYLVVFNREAFQLSEKLFRSVASYIDDNFVQEVERTEYAPAYRRSRRDECMGETALLRNEAPCCPTAAAPKPALSLDEMLRKTDAGFSETLLKLIDQTGKKDSEIYTRANVSRQHFSKIRNNPQYKPTKSTAIAFAIALELDMEQTKDLIGRAGFTLTRSSKFDVIIMYFISQRNYNLFDINAALFEFDQSLLGA